MTVFILLIWFSGGHQAGLDHIEFSSQAACEAARPAIERAETFDRFLTTVHTECLEIRR